MPVTSVEPLFAKPGQLAAGWKSAFAATASLAAGPSVFLVMCFAVYTPALRAEFGWNVGEVAIAAMLGSLCVAVISPIQGKLCDRFGSRIVVLISFPLFGLSLIALSQIGSDIRGFYLGYVAATLLALGVWPLSFMRCVSTWFDQRLGLALGVVNVGPGLGGAIGPVLVGALIMGLGWRVSFLACGLIVLFAAWPITLIWLREKPVSAIATDRPMAIVAGISGRDLWSDRPFWLLMLTFLMLGVFSGAILLNQVTILTDGGLSRGAAIAAQSALGLSSIVARIVTGWLLDRTHVGRIMPILMLVGAGACWLFTVSGLGNVVLLSAIVSGFIIGAEFDVLGYAIRRYHGLAAFGFIFGVVFAAFQVGSAIGVRGMGLTHDAFGSFNPALLALVGICIAIAVLFLLMGPYRFFPPERAAGRSPEMASAQ